MFFASLILYILGVTDPCFIHAQNSQMIPPLQFIAVGWSWQMLDCLLILFSVAMRCAFFPFPGFFL
jgi:hypothetical protein